MLRRKRGRPRKVVQDAEGNGVREEVAQGQGKEEEGQEDGWQEVYDRLDAMLKRIEDLEGGLVALRRVVDYMNRHNRRIQ